MLELIRFINLLLDLYIFVLIAAAILIWLVVFKRCQYRNPAVAMNADFLYRVTEPSVAADSRAAAEILVASTSRSLCHSDIILFLSSTFVLTNLAQGLLLRWIAGDRPGWSVPMGWSFTVRPPPRQVVIRSTASAQLSTDAPC